MSHITVVSGRRKSSFLRARGRNPGRAKSESWAPGMACQILAASIPSLMEVEEALMDIPAMMELLEDHHLERVYL